MPGISMYLLLVAETADIEANNQPTPSDAAHCLRLRGIYSPEL